MDCKKCGVPIEKSSYCPQCKALISSHAIFYDKPKDNLLYKPLHITQKHPIIDAIPSFIYYIAFIAVSYSIFQECRHDRDFWIVTDIFNGIFGGIVLVYPFNVIRYGWFETYNRWKQWFVFIFLLTTLSFIIGEALGIGVM